MSIRANLLLTGKILQKTPQTLGGIAIAGSAIAAKNVVCLPAAKLGDFVTSNGKVLGKGLKMLSPQGKRRIEKEIKADPANSELLGIKVQNPAMYVLETIENAAVEVITTPYLKNYQENKLGRLLDECAIFNENYQLGAEHFIDNNSQDQFDLLTPGDIKVNKIHFDHNIGYKKFADLEVKLNGEAMKVQAKLCESGKHIEIRLEDLGVKAGEKYELEIAPGQIVAEAHRYTSNETATVSFTTRADKPVDRNKAPQVYFKNVGEVDTSNPNSKVSILFDSYFKYIPPENSLKIKLNGEIKIIEPYDYRSNGNEIEIKASALGLEEGQSYELEIASEQIRGIDKEMGGRDTTVNFTTKARNLHVTASPQVVTENLGEVLHEMKYNDPKIYIEFSVGDFDTDDQQLSSSLDKLAVRYLTDAKFAESLESLDRYKFGTYNLKDYVDNKLKAILLEKQKSEPNYKNTLASFKSLLRVNNGDKVVNRFLRSKSFSSNSLLKRFIPAIREYKLKGVKNEDYQVLDLLLSNRKIDKHIQEQLKIVTDIPKSLLEHSKVIDDDLIVKLKKEKALIKSFKLLDEGRLDEAKSEYIKYAKQICNTEQFTYAVMLTPKEFKNDVKFVQAFSGTVNNKFLNYAVRLKADINKIEYEASMFSNQTSVETPEYDDSIRNYGGYYAGDRITHERLHKRNWAINYDWRTSQIEHACKELDLSLAYEKMDKLHSVLHNSREGDFSKVNSNDLHQALDMTFSLERMIPGAYLPGLINSGKLTDEGREKVNQHLVRSGFYYQALVLKEIKAEKDFNELLTDLVNNLKNSNEMSLLQDQLSLFGIEESRYKERFLARVMESDFKLFSHDTKENYVMKYNLDSNKEFRVAYASLESNLEKTGNMLLNHMFQRDEKTGEMVHALSISLDYSNGYLHIAAPKEDIKVKVNGKWINSRASKENKVQVKKGDFVSVSNNGKTDLYYVGFINGQGPVLNLVTKAKAELFNSLVADTNRDKTLAKGVKNRNAFSDLVRSLNDDKSGTMLAQILNSIEAINASDGAAPTLVWTGESKYVEHAIYGPCPHTVTYESKYSGYKMLRGSMVTNEYAIAGAEKTQQAHPFLRLMSTFLDETRQGNQGGAILPESQNLPLLEAGSEENPMIALNGAKAQNLLPASKSENEDKDAALTHVKDLGLKYSLEKSVEAQITQKQDAIKRMEEANDTFELIRAIQDYHQLEPDMSQLENVMVDKLEKKFKEGKVHAQTTQLAHELEMDDLPLVDELAVTLEQTGIVKEAVETVKDFRSDKDYILQALNMLNNMANQQYGSFHFVEAMELLAKVKDFRKTINFIYPTLAGKEKEKPNTIKPFLFSLYNKDIDDNKQAIDPSIYEQIRKEFSAKDTYDQVEFLSRVNFFRRDLDISELITEVTMKINDSDNLSKLLDEFRLYDFNDDLIREAFYESASREDFIWNMSQEQANEVLANIKNPYINMISIDNNSTDVVCIDESPSSEGLKFSIPESTLEYVKSIGEFDDHYNYDLHIYRDKEKKFLGSITFDPLSESLMYKPTNKCGNYPLEEAYVNGFLVDGSADVKLKTGDVLQVADDTYYVTENDDGTKGLALVAKGNAPFIKMLFFDQNRFNAKQGQMPECGWSALIDKILRRDRSGAIKRKIFEGIGLGYDYRNEPSFRVKVNNHRYIGVEPWRQRVPVNSSLHGVDISVDDNKVNFSVEYPYLSTLGVMQGGSFGVVIPMNFYHGGSPGVAIYGFAAKTYIGNGGYVNNIPRVEEIIHTFFEDYQVSREVKHVTTVHLDEIKKDIYQSVMVYADSLKPDRAIDYSKAHPLLKNIFLAMYVVELINNPYQMEKEIDFAHHNLSLEDFDQIDLNKVLRRETKPPRRLVGEDMRLLEAKLTKLNEIIAEYEENGNLDVDGLADLVCPEHDDSPIAPSFERLASHADEDIMILTGTEKGNQEFAQFINESNRPGRIGTFSPSFNRLSVMPVPHPNEPWASLKTPVRSLIHNLNRNHAYNFAGLGPGGMVHYGDSHYRNSVEFNEFVKLYSIYSEYWDNSSAEETIVEFS